MSGLSTAVIGKDTWKLPEGKLWCIFNSTDQISILERQKNGPFNGYGVVDSVQLRGTQGADVKATRELFVSHGAYKLASGPSSAPS